MIISVIVSGFSYRFFCCTLPLFKRKREKSFLSHPHLLKDNNLAKKEKRMTMHSKSKNTQLKRGIEHEHIGDRLFLRKGE